MDDYQERALSYAMYPRGLEYPVLGLASEAGEVAGELKRLIRSGPLDRPEGALESLLDELGDVLWYCAAVCRELGTSLSAVAERNLAKLGDRARRGAISGRGSYR